MKAIVLETSRLYKRLIRDTLLSFELDVSNFDNGTDALAFLNAEEVGLLCISMHLPDMTGIDVCQQVREINERYKHVPILIITSENNPDTLARALRAGATDIIQKDEVDCLGTRLQPLLPARFTTHNAGFALYLEDSTMVANATRKKLQSIGLEMDHALSVQEALTMVDKKEYDIIVTDIVLNEALTGLDFIKSIRLQRELDHTPVLAITATDDVSRRVATLNAGANDYVTKPIVDDEFFARINNLLSAKKLFDQLNRERKRLVELATIDPLTSLNNRHFLMDVAQKRFSEAYRHKQNLSILVIDVDFFKKINDNHGHSVGDDVLKSIAGKLKHFFREEDFVARFGGEEFVVMLPYCSRDCAITRAEKCRTEIEESKFSGLKVTVSIGISTLGLSIKENFDDLFNRADKALYQSKHDGRNRVTCLEKPSDLPLIGQA